MDHGLSVLGLAMRSWKMGNGTASAIGNEPCVFQVGYRDGVMVVDGKRKGRGEEHMLLHYVMRN
jgi:hypothetical protein